MPKANEIYVALLIRKTFLPVWVPLNEESSQEKYRSKAWNILSSFIGKISRAVVWADGKFLLPVLCLFSW